MRGAGVLLLAAAGAAVAVAAFVVWKKSQEPKNGAPGTNLGNNRGDGRPPVTKDSREDKLFDFGLNLADDLLDGWGRGKRSSPDS